MNCQIFIHLAVAAVANGGKTFSDPVDAGFRYGHAFEDPDGQGCEFGYMLQKENR